MSFSVRKEGNEIVIRNNTIPHNNNSFSLVERIEIKSWPIDQQTSKWHRIANLMATGEYTQGLARDVSEISALESGGTILSLDHFDDNGVLLDSKRHPDGDTKHDT